MDIALKQFFSRFTSDEFPPKYVFASTEDGSVVTIDTNSIPDVLNRYKLGGVTPVHLGNLPILTPIL